MANTIQSPGLWLFSNNPIVFKLTGFVDSFVYVKITALSEVITTKYYLRNGGCEIDLSGYIKNLFSEFKNVDTSVAYDESDTMKVVQIEIYSVYSSPYYSQNHFVVYGVTQILGSDIGIFSDSEPDNKFLTGFTRPKYWIGFPFSVSVISTLTNTSDNYIVLENNISGFQTEETNLSSQSVRHFIVSGYVNHAMMAGNYVALSVYEDDASGERMTELLLIDIVKEYIKEAVYLRWLNQFGGYDYYMFYKKDVKETPKTSFVNNYPSTLNSVSGYHPGTMKAVKKEIAEIWVIGASNLTRNEYNELRKISRSPKIDIYIPGQATWMGVNVQDSTWTVPQDEEMMDLELNLLMPEIFAQC